MVDQITKYIIANNLGDWASVLGVIIVAIGFLITIIKVLRLKSTAEAVQEGIIKVREDVLRVETVAEFSAALSVMDEIKRLHRQQAWQILPDRYAHLRKSLITIKTSYSGLEEEHKIALQSAIQIFNGIEKQVEDALTKNLVSLDVPKLNRLISKHIDSLQEVLIKIQGKIGR
jgi:hypothetical protein